MDKSQDFATHEPENAGGVASGARPRRGAFVLRTLVALLVLGIAAGVGMGLYIDRYGQQDRAHPAQVIIVLGSSVNRFGEPGNSLRARTLHAVDLYHRGFAPRIICTGGLGNYPPTEAEAAAQLARTKGVPDADLLQENESTSTWENAVNAARICREQGWTRAVVVSDPYHLWRVHRDFARQGLNVYPSPALDCLRNRDRNLRIVWTGREVLLVLRDVLRESIARH